MGFLWEGSTGARAVQLLREQPPGTVMLTPDLAKALGAKQTLLHQLLANALSLRLIKKVRVEGSAFSGWMLGAGNDSANIEPKPPRRPRSPAEVARAEAAAQRQRDREAKRARPVIHGDGISGTAVASLVELAPAWLCGSVDRIHDVEFKAPRPGAYRRGERATYLDVVHRDGNTLFRGVVRVQALLPEIAAIEVWSGALGCVVRFDCAGFVRVTDERSGLPVDLQAWLHAPTGKPPLIKPAAPKSTRPRKAPRSRPASHATRASALPELKGLRLFNEQQAAAYLGLSVTAFRDLLHADALPRYVVLSSGKLRWRRAQLTALVREWRSSDARAA